MNNDNDIPKCNISIPVLGGFKFSNSILNFKDISLLTFYKICSHGAMMIIGIVLSSLFFHLRMNMSNINTLKWIKPHISTEPIHWKHGILPALIAFIAGACLYLYTLLKQSKIKKKILMLFSSDKTRPCKDSTGRVWTSNDNSWQLFL